MHEVMHEAMSHMHCSLTHLVFNTKSNQIILMAALIITLKANFSFNVLDFVYNSGNNTEVCMSDSTELDCFATLLV